MGDITLEDYIQRQARKELLPATQLCAILEPSHGEAEAPQTPTVPDPTLVNEARNQLMRAFTDARQKGVSLDLLMNSVMLFALVMKRTGLSMDAIDPLRHEICELWDDHDYALHDAAIDAISRRLVELHEAH